MDPRELYTWATGIGEWRTAAEMAEKRSLPQPEPVAPEPVKPPKFQGYMTEKYSKRGGGPDFRYRPGYKKRERW